LLCDLRVRRVKDAKRFLDKYKRVDVAMDAFYNDPSAMAALAKHPVSTGLSTSKLNALFDKYKGAPVSRVWVYHFKQDVI
jgi:DCN1-like protein 1/2